MNLCDRHGAFISQLFNKVQRYYYICIMNYVLCALSRPLLSVNYPANVMNAITTPMIGNASTKPTPMNMIPIN